jgi:hypothetical protein
VHGVHADDVPLPSTLKVPKPHMDGVTVPPLQ